MALISAFNVIRGLASFHLLLAFFFLTAPQKIAEQNVVFLLGESMRIPHVSSFSKPTPVTAFVAVLFAFIGLTDLTAASLPDEIALPFWSSQAPLRVIFFFLLSGYVYVFKPGGFSAERGTYQNLAPGNELKNSVVFAWAFSELALWFWVYSSMSDERKAAAKRLVQKRRAEGHDD